MRYLADKIPFIHICTDDNKEIYDNDDDDDKDDVDDDDEGLRNVFGEPSTCPSTCVRGQRPLLRKTHYDEDLY